MRKFYEKIVAHPKLILVIFGICTLVSVLCKPLVAVNYDMNDYLPKESPSTISLELLNSEFRGGIPNARVMVKDVTIPQALQYKEQISAVHGVTSVTWLDDAADITIPLTTLNTDTVELYYKDSIAIFSVTIESEKRVEATGAIRELIGEENCMSGSAVSTAVATASTVSEVGKIAVIAVLFVLLVLLLTTTSWVEPFVILCGLGTAVLLNAGTNLIFGEISFVTNAAGNILQLAVSLDYSVFLLHRFMECRQEYTDSREAMVDALCKSTSSILSSGLTTVIGFLALCLMQFGIGPDLGLALAKGITISLVTVFVFSPVLMLSTYKWIDKTKHRPFMPSFHKFGKAVAKITPIFIVLFTLVLLPSYLASNSNDFYYGASRIFGESTKLGADTAAIEDVFGKSDTYVLMVPRGSLPTEQALSTALQELPQVTDIISYVDMVGGEIPPSYLDKDTLSQLMSENYSRLVISADADFEGNQTFALIEEIRNIANDYYPDGSYLSGEGISTLDLKSTVTDDMLKVNLLAIGAVFLVLLLMQKSLSLPLVLVLSIEAAIWINLSIPYFRSSTIFYIAYLIISSVQLGATVDYAILMTDRFKELRHTLERREALVKTIESVTLPILTSGITLTVVGFLLGIISTHGLLSQLGYFLGIGAICSLIIVLFVLPGLLALYDKFQSLKPKKMKKLSAGGKKHDEQSQSFKENAHRKAQVGCFFGSGFPLHEHPVGACLCSNGQYTQARGGLHQPCWRRLGG